MLDTFHAYTPKEFNLSGLNGISDASLEKHFGLYQGYVKATNKLNEQLAEFLQGGTIDQEEMPAYSELTRRLGFEYNGMILHEYYFGNLTRQETGAHSPSSTFLERATASFGSYELWKAHFTGVAKMRGVGWAICYQNPETGLLSNHWVSLHDIGTVSGFIPVLVLDVWEHAYIWDYAPTERPHYIETFFSNLDWTVVEKRMKSKALSFREG